MMIPIGITLVGGGRVGKDSLRIAAVGEVDELNALLGLCRAQNKQPELEEVLHQLQQDLFNLGADLATPLDSAVKVPRVALEQIEALEKWIDGIAEKVPPLRNFILPGGTVAAAQLHLARTVCRRAERTIVSLQKNEQIDGNVVKYVNRLSDLLFMMARLANQLDGAGEELWQSN